MAILDINKYYYFRIRNGQPIDIKVSLVPINTIAMTGFQQMTSEQKAFYLEHPTASVMEIWKCEITPPYVPPEQDVQEYAVMKIKELKDACYGAITIDKVQCEMANCVLAGTAVTYSGKRHYTTLQAKAIMEQFMDESDKVSTVYETYKPQIEAASTIAAIDTLYNQAITEL